VLDEDQKEGHEAWGVWVPRGPSGRLKWPAEIKTMVIERIEAGATIASVSREIHANESLVSKWAQNHRESRVRSTDRLGIVEVVAVADTSSPVQHSSHTISCELHLGDVRLSIPPGYPGAHLVEILRALRADP